MKQVCVATLILAMAAVCSASDASPARFRDFKLYTTSAPDERDTNRIVATMRMLNEGKQPLEVHVSFAANPAAGFSGGKFDARIEPAKEAAWQFELRPPDGLKREILTGTISFGQETAPERELHVAVQGPDPADFNSERVEEITARAQVVATHAPRTIEAIRRLTQAAQQKSPPAGAPIILAQNGSSNHRIIHDPAEAELNDAVADFQRAVQHATGASLPASSEDTEGNRPAIRLRRITPPAQWPHVDAYRLRTDRDDVIIEARTVDGLRHGVYGLLTDHLDCHWFMPKKLGEEFPAPADRTLRLARIDEMREPSFFSTASMSWGSAPRWDRQTRSFINRGRMNFGHAWQALIDSNQYSYDRFPDMWSRDRSGKVQVFDHGWSSTNFCSTSPEVIKIVAEKINAQFDANPDAIVASLDPNDLAPLCQCERCLAVDAKYGVKPEDDKQMADRLLHFSREIYDRLKPEHKGKFLGILAYGFQTRPPKSAMPHPQHAVTVCQFPNYFDHTRPFTDPTSKPNRDFLEIVKGWGARSKQLGFYDYYGHYHFFGPWGIIHKIREDLPAFRELGGTFVVIESQPNFAMHGLNLYVAARLVWDIDADVDVLVENYIAKFYGPAADEMREFFRAAERRLALLRPGTHAALRIADDPEFWSELDGILSQAEAKIGGADKRFVDRVTFARDGFTFRQRFAQLQSRRNNADFLRETKTELDCLKAKYPGTDDYWPTLVAPYFWPDIDEMLKNAD